MAAAEKSVPGIPGSVCAGGMENLLLEVFREQQGRIWGFLMRGAASQDVAEDLLQETFLRVWDRRQALEPGMHPDDRDGMRKYLWRVARNLMIDEIRYRQRRRHMIRETAANGPVAAAEPADPAPGVGEKMEWQQCIELVHETVGRVKNSQGRRCLELWLEGLDPHRIGERVGLGTGQVRGLIQRARSEVVLRASNRLRAQGKSVR